MIRLRDAILGDVEGIRLGGLQRIGEGREAEVFALDDGRDLRLARTAALAQAVDHEHAALAAALAAGVPVPAVFERVDVEGRPGLVVERLGTGNLLLEIGARPWRVFAIRRELRELHGRIHRGGAGGGCSPSAASWASCPRASTGRSRPLHCRACTSGYARGSSRRWCPPT